MPTTETDALSNQNQASPNLTLKILKTHLTCNQSHNREKGTPQRSQTNEQSKSKTAKPIIRLQFQFKHTLDKNLFPNPKQTLVVTQNLSLFKAKQYGFCTFLGIKFHLILCFWIPQTKQGEALYK